MAITSSSQILDTSKVYAATAHLTEAVNYLNAAKENLNNAKNYASLENLETNIGNPIPEKTNNLIASIDQRIQEINTLKSNVEAKAESLRSSEQTQYQNYLAEKKRKEEEARKAAEENNSSDRVHGGSGGSF